MVDGLSLDCTHSILTRSGQGIPIQPLNRWAGNTHDLLQPVIHLIRNSEYARIVSPHRGDMVKKLLAGCGMHARRPFHQARTLKDPSADFFLNVFKKKSAVLNQAREQSLKVDQRLELRQHIGLPIMEAMKSRAVALADVPLIKPIRQGVTYFLNRWERLIVPFTVVSQLDIDNGSAERRLRRLASGRESFVSTSRATRGPIDGGPPDALHEMFTLALMRHFGMTPRTTAVGEKQRNGDVEATNGWLKRSLTQAILLRGHRDFDTVTDWQALADGLVRKVNAGRGPRLTQPQDSHLRGPNRSALSRCNPACMRAARRARQASNRPAAHYWVFGTKPGGFLRHIYREEVFPSLAFRKAYDAIQVVHSGIKGDVEDLRILHLAASTMASTVETALCILLENKGEITVEAVKALATPDTVPTLVPDMAPMQADLSDYDSLLGGSDQAAA